MEKVIYKITNLVNDKFYVGSTVNKKVRFRQHRKLLRAGRHHCKHLQAAWNLYGEIKFLFEVIEVVSVGADLAAVEDAYLLEHVGKPYCYNSGYSSHAPWRGAPAEVTPNYGKKMSDEAKQAISDATRKQWSDADPRTGTKHTEETKAKISAKIQKAIAEGRGGKFIPSEETRRKMSDALKGNQCAKGHKRTESEKEAIRQRTLGNQNWLGKNHTEESIAKMSRAVIATKPDGTQERFIGMNTMKKHTGIGFPTIIRACATGNPIKTGKCAGWTIRHEV